MQTIDMHTNAMLRIRIEGPEVVLELHRALYALAWAETKIEQTNDPVEVQQSVQAARRRIVNALLSAEEIHGSDDPEALHPGGLVSLLADDE